ncbi:hypothetical protein KGF57_004573 [Candida theae]|uniref:Transcription elongation factor Eaf N-terminal domain-containing protein n=1 Tax=Candida theae TaxID=1198502 RepID=A0AAD5BAT1_9ASCO|nr:uncharacterized protein KGF57_004573 [Candida theae]KAI5949750.1 hypothetical protein KGF57_004573 [Candida theae]
MSLPDGEYDLDVSILNKIKFEANAPVTSEVGQSPRTKPIKIYSESQNLSAVGASSHLNKRPISNGSSQEDKSNSQMEFSLILLDRKKKILKLDRLSKSTRASEARNGPIHVTDTTKSEVNNKQESPKRKLESAKSSSPNKRIPETTVKKGVPGSAMKWNPRTDPLRKSRVASPRPLLASRQQQKTKLKGSEVDGSDRSGNSSPQKVPPTKHEKEQIKLFDSGDEFSPTKAPVSDHVEGQSVVPKPLTDNATKSQVDDLDDDFKDLEDQLQELLGEGIKEESGRNSQNGKATNQAVNLQNKSRDDKSSGSDVADVADDDDEEDDGNDDDYGKARFQNIQFENSSVPKKTQHFALTSNNGRPMSLRDFLGGGRVVKDVVSSSEED